MVTSLGNALEGLLEFLRKQDSRPPTYDVTVIEIEPNAAVDTAGRIRVRSDEFRQPETYEERFADLMRSGMPWINISCYGVRQGQLVVAIEHPASPSSPSDRTVLNYSGPAAAVLANGWNVEHVIVVE